MADASTAHPGITAPARSTPARTALATIASALATLIGLLVLVWLVLFITRGRFLKHTFERIASAQTGRTVRVAGDFTLYFDPLATRFRAEGLSISNPDWATRPALFTSTLIDMRIDTLSLLFGHQRTVDWLTLVNGAVDLEWDARHRHNSWTFGTATPGKPFRMPLIRRAAIDGTRLRFRDPMLRVSADVGFRSVAATDSRVDKALSFAGTGLVRGTPFTLHGSQTSPDQLLSGGENRFTLHADGARTHIDVAATLPGVAALDGSDLTVAARGRNLSDIFDVIGVAVPATRDYRLRGHLVKQGGDYRLTRIVGTFGDTDIAGTLRVVVPRTTDPQARISLTADLASRRADLIDIGPFVGYDPATLASRGATAAATTHHKRDGVPRILPDAPLRSDSIKGFDASVRYRVAAIRQPFVPVSNILLGLTLDHALMRLQPLDFDMAGGRVTSIVTIDARTPTVATDYDIRISPTALGRLFARFGVADSGTTGTLIARIRMHGTGDTLRQSLATANGRIAVILPRGTVWTSYTQLAELDIGTFVQRLMQDKLKKPVQINCGLIGFTVRGGIAAADPVLIDTSKNVMTATGGFSFRDESLDLAFRAHAKKFSLFSGQSPIGITGHFARPGLRIVTPQLLGRIGAGIALGVVATPFAALAAFVDPGDAKAAACGPVLAGANAAAQRTAKGKPRTDIGTGKSAKAQRQSEPRKFLGIRIPQASP